MRLLDRFGPAFAALAAALLIMVGAAAGWHLLNAQPPGDAKQPPQAASTPPAAGKKKSFAAAIDEAQRDREPAATAPASSVVQIVVTGRTQKDRPGIGGIQGFWDIRISEVVNGERVEHTTNDWAAIVPLLKQQIAGGGAKTIAATVGPGPATRLEANQLVNDCKRAGFFTIDYSGPALFLGREDDSWKASAIDAPSVRLKIDLTKSTGFLPDWSNGWAVLNGTFGIIGGGPEKVVRSPEYELLKQEMARTGGATGPVASLVESMSVGSLGRPEGPAGSKGVVPSDLAKHIAALQGADVGAQASIEIVTASNGGMEDLSRSGLRIRQKFPRGESTTSVVGGRSFASLISRLVRFVGRRLDVQVGSVDLNNPVLRSLLVNPLHVNAVLNACRRSGVEEVNYSGQKIVTGSQGKYEFPTLTGSPDSLPLVKIVLALRDLEGDLPDEANGWTVVSSRGRVYVVRESDRERVLESLRPKTEGAVYDAEVNRLAKLPNDEFEREIAKKPSLLQDRFRKAVGAAKGAKK